MDFIKDNYEWIFSGVGVFILGVIFSWITYKKKAVSISKNTETKIKRNKITSNIDIRNNSNSDISDNEF